MDISIRQQKKTAVDPWYEQKYSAVLKKIVLREFSDTDCTVFLFGSRASGNYRWGADFDIGVEGIDADEFMLKRHRILAAVEESIIPWEVDMVHFDSVDEDFRKTALEEIELWKNG